MNNAPQNVKNMYAKTSILGGLFSTLVPRRQARLEKAGIVPRLYLERSPLTVLFRVVAVIIYSVDSCIKITVSFLMFQIRFIHIVSKFLKRFPKTFDSTSTVVTISSIVGVIASL